MQSSRSTPAVASPRPRRAGLGAALSPSARAALLALAFALDGWASGRVLAAQPPAPSAQHATPAPRPLLAPLTDGAQPAWPEVDPATLSPAAFLGYSLGERFTPHDRLVDYLGALLPSCPRLRLFDYGATWEERPLRLAVLTSPPNHGRLDELRQKLARLGDPARPGAEKDRLAAELPAVVWLSYGVHGNESSSAEAAMAVVHLLCGAGGEWEKALDDLIVVVDPLANPDGRDRYARFFAERMGSTPDATSFAAEHTEPWPGGRFNHYLFDLNRDWSWATQRETRARIAAYRAWEPQVHVDFHEMGRESTYFFPPAADPVNPRVDGRILGWLERFGRGNAAAFDRLGWTYFVRDVYDLFYPGYGDAYPSLRGAVGMTYEVAGGGSAGVLLRRADGRSYGLADRIARHVTTSLATLETARAERRALLRGWAAVRADVAADEGPTFLWAADAPNALDLAHLLERHGIAVSQLASSQELSVRDVRGGEAVRRGFAGGTFAASSRQPLGALLRALLERETPLPPAFLREQRRRLEEGVDLGFYDVTAWSLPLAWNLEMWWSEEGPSELRSFSSGAGASGIPPAAIVAPAETVTGFLVRPQGLASYRLLAALLADGATETRVSTEAFHLGGKEYPAGTLFVPRAGQSADLGERMAQLARSTGAAVQPATTSFSERGPSLGSSSLARVKSPRIALVRGRGVDATSFGAIWHLLDREVGARQSVVELDRIGDLPWDRLDVVVLPDGAYGPVTDSTVTALRAWVEEGGVLVTVGAASVWAQKKELLAVRRWEAPKRDPQSDDTVAQTAAERVADEPLDTPGAVLATELRRSSVLAAGVAAPPPVLFSGDEILLPTGKPQVDVLLVSSTAPVLSGFAWPEAVERLRGALLVARQPLGKGRVVAFAQDPVFRGFWRGTMPLFLNAVLLEASWEDF